MPPKHSSVQARSPSSTEEHLQEDHSHHNVAFEELVLAIRDMQTSLQTRLTAVKPRPTSVELTNHLQSGLSHFQSSPSTADSKEILANMPPALLPSQTIIH